MKKILLQTNQYFTLDNWHKRMDEIKMSKVECHFEFLQTKAEFNSNINHADAGFCFSLPDDEILSRLTNKYIYSAVSSKDYFDNKYSDQNLVFSSSKGLASELIAEYCLTTALFLIKNIHYLLVDKSKKRWNQSFYIDNHRPLKSYKVGVLGLGSNGLKIVEIFNRLGCIVYGCSRSPKEYAFLKKWYPVEKLHDFLNLSDILIMAVPLTEMTKGIIGKKELEILIKNKAFFINVARGPVVDEKELVRVLKAGELKGSALDVFETEPLPRRSKLWKIPNTLITPHIAGNANLLAKEIQGDFLKKIDNHFQS